MWCWQWGVCWRCDGGLLPALLLLEVPLSLLAEVMSAAAEEPVVVLALVVLRRGCSMPLCSS